MIRNDASAKTLRWSPWPVATEGRSKCLRLWGCEARGPDYENPRIGAQESMSYYNTNRFNGLAPDHAACSLPPTNPKQPCLKA